MATRALPAGVRGPVERRQGRERRIRSAWRARRSGDQPLDVRSSSFAEEGKARFRLRPSSFAKATEDKSGFGGQVGGRGRLTSSFFANCLIM